MTEYVTIYGVTFPVEFDGEFYRITCGGCQDEIVCYLLDDVKKCMLNHVCLQVCRA